MALRLPKAGIRIAAADEAAAAIATLQAQVTRLQRDLLATETGVLQQIGAHKHSLAQRIAVERGDVYWPRARDHGQGTRHGAANIPTLQPLIESIMQDWLKGVDDQFARFNGFMKDYRDREAKEGVTTSLASSTRS